MNSDPFESREALARLPRFTQRFWTWLSGLTHQDELPRSPWSVSQHLWAYAGVAGMAIGLSAWATQTLVAMARAAQPF